MRPRRSGACGDPIKERHAPASHPYPYNRVVNCFPSSCAMAGPPILSTARMQARAHANKHPSHNMTHTKRSHLGGNRVAGADSSGGPECHATEQVMAQNGRVPQDNHAFLPSFLPSFLCSSHSFILHSCCSLLWTGFNKLPYRKINPQLNYGNVDGC